MTRPAARNGQTLGKQLVGIRVVRDDGGLVDAGTQLVGDIATAEPGLQTVLSSATDPGQSDAKAGLIYLGADHAYRVRGGGLHGRSHARSVWRDERRWRLHRQRWLTRRRVATRGSRRDRSAKLPSSSETRSSATSQAESRWKVRVPNAIPAAISAAPTSSPTPTVPLRDMALEQRAQRVDDVLDRVDVETRLQPRRRERHRQQDAREQQQRHRDRC